MSGDAPVPIDRQSLATLRRALDSSPVIVELRLGRGDHVPERLVFQHYDLLVDYLRMVARPGDTLSAWRFDEACRDDNAVVRARPLKGAD